MKLQTTIWFVVKFVVTIIYIVFGAVIIAGIVFDYKLHTESETEQQCERIGGEWDEDKQKCPWP